jgi:hypothetical protein
LAEQLDESKLSHEAQEVRNVFVRNIERGAIDRVHENAEALNID